MDSPELQLARKRMYVLTAHTIFVDYMNARLENPKFVGPEPFVEQWIKDNIKDYDKEFEEKLHAAAMERILSGIKFL